MLGFIAVSVYAVFALEHDLVLTVGAVRFRRQHEDRAKRMVAMMLRLLRHLDRFRHELFMAGQFSRQETLWIIPHSRPELPLMIPTAHGFSGSLVGHRNALRRRFLDARCTACEQT